MVMALALRPFSSQYRSVRVSSELNWSNDIPTDEE
jgi:hypothetical protein